MQRSGVHKTTLMAHVPDRFKTQEMCIEAVACNPYTLKYIHGHLKTEEMCNEAVEKKSTHAEICS